MRLTYFTIVIACLITIVACSSEHLDGSDSVLPQLSIEPETLITETGDLLLSSIGQVLVDSDGYIIISDAQQRFLHALDPSGQFLHTLGGRGSGPGEYEFPGPMAIDEEDRIHLLDWGARNIIVYAKNGDEWIFDYDFSLNTSNTGMFTQFFPEANREYMTINRFNPFTDDNGNTVLRRINASGEIVADSLHLSQNNEMFTVTGGSGQPMMSLSVPEVHLQGRFTSDYDGNYYYGWTESLEVQRKVSGEEGFAPFINYDLSNRPFTAADGDSVISRYSNNLEREHIRDLRTEFPDYKPAFRNMLVDDNGYVWIHVFTEKSEGEWLLFDDQGEPVFRTSFPTGERVVSLRHNRVYAVTESEEGLPAIQVYSYSL